MGYPTPIEWTDATWNPVGGCDIHSPGCINCYAQRLAASPRLRHHPLYAGVVNIAKGKPVFNGKLTALHDGHEGWKWPLRWRGAKEPKLGAGTRSLIFVGDMSDLMHQNRPIKTIDRVVETIMLSNHIGQLLSKRSDIMAKYFLDTELQKRLAVVRRDSVWLGFSAERQTEFDDRWQHMARLANEGFQIFVSYEPALGSLRLPRSFLSVPKRPWVIAGGESGDGARPANPDWFLALRDQCAENGLPFFFKQWGEWAHEGQHDAEGQRLIWSYEAEGEQRIGKKRAGRLLDGVEHSAFPKVEA